MQKKEHDLAFEQGFACACATMWEMHRDDTAVMHVLTTCFPNIESLKESNIDPYDKQRLMALYKRWIS
jgi:hypothetical protein